MRAPGAISVTAASRTYETSGGKIRALDGVSLDIASGSSVGIMGPSGCGKSTLLALMGGLDTPSAGTVRVGGLEVSSLGRRERTRLRRERFGFVFQNDNLLPFLTASENVALQLALGGEYAGSPPPSDLLAEFGLAAQADKLPDQLSGGQRQRVAVAAALAHGPSVLLADEPTGSLDADNVATVVDLLLAAQRRVGATLVVVSHDANVCRRMSRVLTLRNGRLVADTALAASTGGR